MRVEQESVKSFAKLALVSWFPGFLNQPFIPSYSYEKAFPRVFLWNPPAPECIGPCGRCPCVPKYWTMRADAFIDYGDPELGTTDQFIPPFIGILEYKNVGFSFAGGGGFPFPIHPQIHFWGLRTHGLKTDETVEITYHEHPLYGPRYLYLHPGNGQWKITRLVVTLAFTFAHADWSKIPLASHPKAVTPDPARDFAYFDCLSPNRFYFENSEVLSDWPAEIEVTPYYP